ncbi:sex determination protein fruitless isoform X1 [Hyalella azteca]|uniref:Sex determination protein fruitless isoform X1 n=1 Tax=Hyalella azteca TaxID=294128 RepID=A0A8B7P4I3_HYAAZ|nr:sex determination protein fruitless isoform X1 [Hyalella azteca]XP_018020860.1 sex determination protein fruitless isoform X1 [Hyalella azteca]
MGADQFLLTWNNHRANFASVFSDFRLQGQLVDVTLLCDGGSYPAHRLVLAACSPYFASLFCTLDSSHPVIFLRDVRQAELEALLEFIYRGQVSVANSELGGLIKIAESLRIKGLGDVSQREPTTSPTPNGNQQLLLNSGMKRSASPNFSETHSTTFSLHNTASGVGAAVSSNRSKKVARRTNINQPQQGNEENLKNMVGTSGVASTASTFLPDLKAILTAANSYTQGLAATFPALAAVSAAAAHYSKQNGSYEDNNSGGEEGYKLRWCLEKGKEQLQHQASPSKLKTEHEESAEQEVQELDDPSSNDSSFEGSQNACDATQYVQDDNNSTSMTTKTDNSAATCHLLQQLYTGTTNAAVSTSDVSSLLSTYQQLLTSSTGAEQPNASVMVDEDASTPHSSSAIPTTIADVSAQAKDAKCLTCQLCGANIKHTANFRRHMKQHLNPRRFPCPWCSAAFGRKDNLKTHTRKHHPAEVEAQEGGGVTSSQGATTTAEDGATLPADAATAGPVECNQTIEDACNDKEDDASPAAEADRNLKAPAELKWSKKIKTEEEDEERREEEPLVIDEDDEDDDDEEDDEY